VTINQLAEQQFVDSSAKELRSLFKQWGFKVRIQERKEESAAG